MKLAVLHHDEAVRIDPDRLAALYAAEGEDGAEGIIARAMEEIAVRLTEIQRFADEGRVEPLARSAGLLIKLATAVGMPTFAAVAGDVLATTLARDGPGRAATLARLLRIGDRSLNAAWDLRDITTL